MIFLYTPAIMISTNSNYTLSKQIIIVEVKKQMQPEIDLTQKELFTKRTTLKSVDFIDEKTAIMIIENNANGFQINPNINVSTHQTRKIWICKSSLSTKYYSSRNDSKFWF